MALTHVEAESDLAPEAALQQWVANWNPYLIEKGFRPVSQTATTATYEGRYLTIPMFLLGLVTFPLGILIWIFGKKRQGLTVSAEPTTTGSRWVIRGHAYARVRNSFRASGFRPVAA